MSLRRDASKVTDEKVSWLLILFKQVTIDTEKALNLPRKCLTD